MLLLLKGWVYIKVLCAGLKLLKMIGDDIDGDRKSKQKSPSELYAAFPIDGKTNALLISLPVRMVLLRT